MREHARGRAAWQLGPEILRASAIGMQAQAALLDGDDEAALGHLRRHWIVMRTDLSPMASELGSLLKESP